MGKLRRFDVLLDNPTGIYSPGDVLSGQVIVSTAEEIPVHGEWRSIAVAAGRRVVAGRRQADGAEAERADVSVIRSTLMLASGASAYK